jgi:hypothetical protein
VHWVSGSLQCNTICQLLRWVSGGTGWSMIQEEVGFEWGNRSSCLSDVHHPEWEEMETLVSRLSCTHEWCAVTAENMRGLLSSLKVITIFPPAACLIVTCPAKSRSPNSAPCNATNAIETKEGSFRRRKFSRKHCGTPFYKTTQQPPPEPLPLSNFNRAALVAASNTSSTPSPVKLEHSRYFLAPQI